MGGYFAWLSGCNYDPYSDHIQGLWALAAREKQDIQIKVLSIATCANNTLLTGKQFSLAYVSAPDIWTFTASIANEQIISAFYNICTEKSECIGNYQE